MNIKKIFVLVIFAIAIVGIMAPLNAVNIDNNVKMESKSKIASYRITWDGNGGKIGAKKTVSTTVKKSTKIGKLPTPKRTAYTFQGWYTKKTGGTKITKNTVVKKKVTYYSQWKKAVITSTDLKLIGKWQSYSYQPTLGFIAYYIFNDNGRFSYMSGSHTNLGNYKLSSGKITFTNITTVYGSGLKEKYPDTVAEYQITKDSSGNPTLKIAHLDYSNRNSLPFSFTWDYFYRMS